MKLNNIWKYGLMAILGLTFTGCAYTESAMQYAKEGTKRVEEGYKAKAAMTKEIVTYLKVSNKDCGTNMRVENGIPIVNVKPCVEFDEAMKVVERTPIVQPQKVKDMVESVGGFVGQTGGVLVSGFGLYLGNKTQQKQMQYNYLTNKDNNTLQQGMWDTYTGSYQNNSVQVVDPTVVTNETVQVVSPEVVNPEIVNPVVVEQPTQVITDDEIHIVNPVVVP